MKAILQYVASWYWERMRRAERRIGEWGKNELDHYLGDGRYRSKAMRLKDRAETLERWARWWG